MIEGVQIEESGDLVLVLCNNEELFKQPSSSRCFAVNVEAQVVAHGKRIRCPVLSNNQESMGQ